MLCLFGRDGATMLHAQNLLMAASMVDLARERLSARCARRAARAAAGGQVTTR